MEEKPLTATALFLKWKSEEQHAGMAMMVPLGRTGEVDVIQGVVAFLVSKDAGWVNRQIIRSNGGFASTYGGALSLRILTATTNPSVPNMSERFTAQSGRVVQPHNGTLKN